MTGGDKIPTYIHGVPKAVMGSGGFTKLPLFPGVIWSLRGAFPVLDISL